MNILKIPAMCAALVALGFTPSAAREGLTGFLTPTARVEQPGAARISENASLVTPAKGGLTRPQQRLGENSPLVPPFCETFDNFRTDMEHDDFDRYFQVIDANNDNRSWGLYNYAQAVPYGRCAYLLFPLDVNRADDWLITRAVKLEKNKYYCINMDAALFLNNTNGQPQTFEVKVGNYNDADGLDTTVIGQTEISSSSFTHVEGWFKPQFTAIYYIGVHATSPRYNEYYNYLFVDNIAVGAAMNGNVPSGVTDIVMTNDPNGSPKVEISFKAPATDLDGNPLADITELTVKRENTVIASLKAVKPGETCTLTDNPGADGNYGYTFTTTSSTGEGATVQMRHTAGIAEPLPPVITAFEEIENNMVRIAWEAPATDVNGNAINPEALTYTVAEYVDGQEFVVADEVSGLEAVYAPDLGTSGQALAIATVRANINGKKSTEANTEYIAVGDPYPIPHHNSFTLDDYYAYVLAFDNKENVTWRMLDNFSDPDAQDGDNGYISMIGNAPGQSCELQTGKIDLRQATEPVMTFYTFVYTDDENQIRVSVIDAATGERTALPVTDLGTFERAGWQKVTYRLNEFAGKIVRIGLEGYIVTHGYIPVDNFRIAEAPLSDLSVASVDYPRQSGAATPFDINVLVENSAARPSGSYTVDLLDGARVAATAEGKAIPAYGSSTVTLTSVFSAVSPATTTFTVRINNEGDENPGDNFSKPFDIAYLAPVHPVVTDLTATENDGKVRLTWSTPDISKAAPESTTEDFEAYEAFDNTFGDWTLLNLDQGYTAGFDGMSMPVDGTMQSFWIMEAANEFSFLPTHSGDKVAVAMYGLNESYNGGIPNNDWLISPELYGGRQHIDFWARSLTEDYGAEIIEVLYSTTGNKPANFRSLLDQIEVPAEWTNYYVALPEGSKYFAIRYVSDNLYMFLLDDITFIPAGTPRSLELKGYNVYRNSVKLNDAPVSATTFDTTRDLDRDEYYVTAVYDRGESAGSNLAALGIASIDGIGPDDTAADGPVEYFSLQGVRVDASSLVPGIYIRRQGQKAEKIVVR